MASTSSSNESQTTQAGNSPLFSKEQYEDILKLLKREPVSENKTKLPGIFTLSTRLSPEDWILDTRAINHIASDMNALKNILENKKFSNIQLPNGNMFYVSQTGACILESGQELKNVLRAPDFKYNLVTISKLTKELKCSVSFLPDFAIL